jgi:hypothetical protein
LGPAPSYTNAGPSGSAPPGSSRTPDPESSITYAASASVNRVFTGTAMAPASWIPANASIQSIEFGSRIATRSPGATPASRSPPATRAARSHICW